MANQFFTDTPNTNAILEVHVGEDDTFHFKLGNYNDTLQVSGEGNATGNLGVGNDYFSAEDLCGHVTVHGGTGADTIIGSSGNDHLYGDDGQDVIKGGSGDDLINGGQGKDVLTGGSGHNTFVIDHYSDALYSKSSGQGVDVITDFKCGDKIDFGAEWGNQAGDLVWDSVHSDVRDSGGIWVAHLTGLEGDTLAFQVVDGHLQGMLMA